eukprot:PLAT374.1.p1 GENE.PLAT374.1~~PLAT374.1.p1  ORF type:complete len:105 (-),score=0.80 PLAT374.1:2-316(-)
MRLKTQWAACSAHGCLHPTRNTLRVRLLPQRLLAQALNLSRFDNAAILPQPLGEGHLTAAQCGRTQLLLQRVAHHISRSVNVLEVGQASTAPSGHGSRRHGWKW